MHFSVTFIWDAPSVSIIRFDTKYCGQALIFVDCCSCITRFDWLFLSSQASIERFSFTVFHFPTVIPFSAFDGSWRISEDPIAESENRPD
jgi:hypothetical protein